MFDALRNVGGEMYRGEFSSADASALTEANARFKLYGPGSTTELTLGTNDTVIVSDVEVTTATSGHSVKLYDGSDNTAGAGELITYRKAMGATGPIDAGQLDPPHWCQRGTWPKVSAGAGQIDVLIRGVIQRGT